MLLLCCDLCIQVATAQNRVAEVAESPNKDNLLIAKLKNCQRGQTRATTSAAAEAAVQAAAAADVAVANSGLSYVRDLPADCWVLLRADTAQSAEAAVAILSTSGMPRRFVQVTKAG